MISTLLYASALEHVASDHVRLAKPCNDYLSPLNFPTLSYPLCIVVRTVADPSDTIDSVPFHLEVADSGLRLGNETNIIIVDRAEKVNAVRSRYVSDATSLSRRCLGNNEAQLVRVENCF